MDRWLDRNLLKVGEPGVDSTLTQFSAEQGDSPAKNHLRWETVSKGWTIPLAEWTLNLLTGVDLLQSDWVYQDRRDTFYFQISMRDMSMCTFCSTTEFQSLQYKIVFCKRWVSPCILVGLFSWLVLKERCYKSEWNQTGRYHTGLEASGPPHSSRAPSYFATVSISQRHWNKV